MEDKQYQELAHFMRAMMREIGDFRHETNARFDRLEARVEKLEKGLESVETRLKSVEKGMESVETELRDVKERLRAVEKQLNRYHAVAYDNRAEMQDLSDRLGLLESKAA